jgi:hypothetical protein
VTEKQLSLNISSQKKLRQSPPQNETLAAVAIPYRGAMMLIRVDECRRRADECRRNAAQTIADDVLRGAYLDLARLWREMAHQAQQKEFGSNADIASSDLKP